MIDFEILSGGQLCEKLNITNIKPSNTGINLNDYYIYNRNSTSYSRITYDPTGNCQLYSIPNFNDIIFRTINSDNTYLDRVLCKIYLRWTKPLLLIDVLSQHNNLIKKTFGNNILSEMGYTSTYCKHELNVYVINVITYLNEKYSTTYLNSIIKKLEGVEIKNNLEIKSEDIPF